MLTHQYLDQLALPDRQVVFGNVGTLAAFRVGHADGRALAGEFGDTFTPAQFADLLVTVSSSACWKTPGLRAVSRHHPPAARSRGR